MSLSEVLRTLLGTNDRPCSSVDHAMASLENHTSLLAVKESFPSKLGQILFFALIIPLELMPTPWNEENRIQGLRCRLNPVIPVFWLLSAELAFPLV